MAVSFDGPGRNIELSAVGDYAASRIYSLWKEWVRSGNAEYPPAFDTTGGDPVGGSQEVAPYYFLRTDLGWRIKPPEADGVVTLSGNLFPRVASDEMFLSTEGDFTVLVRQEVSTRAVVVETGISGLTASESQELSELHAASYNRRIWDQGANTITIYAEDGVTPLKEFDTNDDLSEITPK